MNTHTECGDKGIDATLDLFASPRMPVRPCEGSGKPGGYPIMALYIANLSAVIQADRLKWACPPLYRRDLYRRYCVSNVSTDPTFIDGNVTIGPERGQSLNVDEGVILTLQNLYNKDEATQNDILNGIVKDIMKQILDTNFINMVAKARGWN